MSHARICYETEGICPETSTISPTAELISFIKLYILTRAYLDTKTTKSNYQDERSACYPDEKAMVNITQITRSLFTMKLNISPVRASITQFTLSFAGEYHMMSPSPRVQTGLLWHS